MNAANVRPVRVLIIEDHKDAADSLAALMRLAGFEVQVAYRGDEGLQLARTNRPDCVVSDVGLPGLDGYELAQQFRRDKALKGIPLIALTAYSDAEKAKAAGFNDHLIKPANYASREGRQLEVRLDKKPGAVIGGWVPCPITPKHAPNARLQLLSKGSGVGVADSPSIPAFSHRVNGSSIVAHEACPPRRTLLCFMNGRSIWTEYC